MRKIDVVLDTDAFNEIDDQYAIAYLLRSKDRLNTVAIYAAPFSNSKAETAKIGMEKSYDEILNLLQLLQENDLKQSVFKGAESYLPSEKEAVLSPAVVDLCERAETYTRENPLYVVAIGAITNIASALLVRPELKEKIVVVWLGGHSHDLPNTAEFNMYQDIAAARVVMKSGVPFVQLPCRGVVREFRISKPEIEKWLLGKTALTDYLARITISEAGRYAKDEMWTRVIWDVVAVAWLLNDNNRFMESEKRRIRLPEYDNTYSEAPLEIYMDYVYCIKRDALMSDLIRKLTM